MGSTVIVAGLLNLFPQWTGDNVLNDPHIRGQLKLAIFFDAQEIKAVTFQ